MPRKQKLTERQLLPEDNVLAKPVEEVVFKEEDKSVKQVNHSISIEKTCGEKA